MMESEILQAPWPFDKVMHYTIDSVSNNGLNMDAYLDDRGFSSVFSTLEDYPQLSSAPCSCSTLYSGDLAHFPEFNETLHVWSTMEDIPMDFQEFQTDWDYGFVQQPLNHWDYEILQESRGSFPPQQPLNQPLGEDLWSTSPSLKSEESIDLTGDSLPTFTEASMEIDNQSNIYHLLKAYGEAMEKDQRELAAVIFRCASEKGSPAGTTLERLAFNFTNDGENQGDYLRQESCKNFEAAFKAFYQIFPYGRFAHFAANSAILEATADGTEMVHIVDFDLGEGVQWPPLIEALARQKRALKLTAIKWEEDGASWRFEETKRRLCNHARPLGLKLKMEETEMEDLVSELTRMKKTGGGREWLAFNCMAGLPHVGKERSRRLVGKFLQAARDFIANPIDSKRGILVLGDADPCGTVKNCSVFESFFEGHLAHYGALLESMESAFPAHLGDARTAMETLFVAPYVSSLSWLQKWEEASRGGGQIQAGVGLKGWRLRMENIMEAKEMVKKDGRFGVRIEGEEGNEMVLQWKGTPLVRVSTWINHD